MRTWVSSENALSFLEWDTGVNGTAVCGRVYKHFKEWRFQYKYVHVHAYSYKPYQIEKLQNVPGFKKFKFLLKYNIFQNKEELLLL